jgi:hypothetical protein
VGAAGFWPLVRTYWTFVLLGIAAAVLFLVGAPTKAALAGAGFAFAGAAVTRFVDIAGARKAAEVRANEVRLTVLDETRRLAYAALPARASGERALFDATLVDALAHHGLEVNPEEAAGYLQSLDQDASRRWLEAQIDVLPLSGGRSRRAPGGRYSLIRRRTPGMNPPIRTRHGVRALPPGAVRKSARGAASRLAQ